MGRDESGQVAVPAVGTYDLGIVFSYTDEYAKEFESGDSIPICVACDFLIMAVVEQPQAWYNIRTHEKWKPIKLQMTIDGAPLTEEQLARVQPIVQFENDLSCKCEISPTDSSWYVYIGCDENGSYADPSTGQYKMTVSEDFADAYGNHFFDEDTVSFEIQRYSKF